MKNKLRLDVYLVQHNFFESREKARSAIMAGNVLVNEVVITKSGYMIKESDNIRVKSVFPYVSRGALKLKKAIEYFDIDVKNKIAIDIGASTGGFTEILLEYGANKVYAVDVGTNQLAWKLRNNPHVVVMENTNARFIDRISFEEPPQLAVMDVSFISITKIIPSLIKILQDNFIIVSLIKPQFELDREYIKKRGYVEEKYRKLAINKITDFLNLIGLSYSEIIESPITGAKSHNREFLICIYSKK